MPVFFTGCCFAGACTCGLLWLLRSPMHVHPSLLEVDADVTVDSDERDDDDDDDDDFASKTGQCFAV